MSAVPAMAFGLSSVAWTAVGAIATCAIAGLTLGSVVFVAQQLRLARRQQAEGVIERGTSALSSARSELQELKAAARQKERLGLSSMKRVRDVVFAYEAYIPIFELTLETKGIRGAETSNWFFDDLKTLLIVLRYLNQQTRGMIDVFSKDVDKILETYLTKVEASEEESIKARELWADRDLTKTGEFLDLLSTTYLIKKGASATQLIEKSSLTEDKPDSTTFDADLFSSFGGDAENVAELDAWMDEIGTMLDQVEAALDRIGAALGRLK